MIKECQNCEHLIKRYGYCPVIEDWIDKMMPIIMPLIVGISIAIIVYSAGDMLIEGSSIMKAAADTAAQVKMQTLGKQLIS